MNLASEAWLAIFSPVLACSAIRSRMPTELQYVVSLTSTAAQPHLYAAGSALLGVYLWKLADGGLAARELEPQAPNTRPRPNPVLVA